MNDNNIQGRERPAFTVEDSSRQGFSEACAKLEEALLNPALSDEYGASARENHHLSSTVGDGRSAEG